MSNPTKSNAGMIYPRKNKTSQIRVPIQVAETWGHSATGECWNVRDSITGKAYRVRRASCGLGCRCDAVIVKELKEPF